MHGSRPAATFFAALALLGWLCIAFVDADEPIPRAADILTVAQADGFKVPNPAETFDACNRPESSDKAHQCAVLTSA